MDFSSISWTLKDWPETIDWCRERNEQGISCIIDILGENIKQVDRSNDLIEKYKEIIIDINKLKLDASVAIKPTSMGAMLSDNIFRSNVIQVLELGTHKNVRVEMDMEGLPLIDQTIAMALDSKEQGYGLTLALQANMMRSKKDLRVLVDSGINVRLVKGAYIGDIKDFVLIQKSMKLLTEELLKISENHSVGTHDPEIVNWYQDNPLVTPENTTFGFLKGLADEAKLELADDGWKVAEYVPFGPDTKAYIFRRERYLSNLVRLGRQIIQ